MPADGVEESIINTQRVYRAGWGSDMVDLEKICASGQGS